MASIFGDTSRRSADETLQDALARVAAAPNRISEILDGFSEPFIAFTSERVILKANVAAERFFGYGRHGLDLGRTDQIVPARLRQPDAPPQLATEDLTTVELPGLRSDGTEVPTVWTFGHAPGPHGPIFVLIVQDRASRDFAVEHRFRAVYENALDGIMLVDDMLRVVDANPAACLLLGRSREQIIGTNTNELVPPDDRGRAPERMGEFRAAGNMKGEGVILLPDGSTRRAEFGAVANVSPGVHLSMFRDIEDRKRAEETQRFLDQASTLMAATLDYDETLSSVARLAVPRIADWASVDMLEEDGSFRRVAVVHVDPAKIELAKELHRLQHPTLQDASGLGAVARTGKPELIEVVTDELLAARLASAPEMLDLCRGLGLRSAMTVPLYARGRVVGAISLVSAESRRRYGSADLSFAEELARRTGYAVANAMFVRDLQLANQSKDLFLRRAEHLQRTATQLVRTETVDDIARAFEETDSRSPPAARGWSLFVRVADQLELLATTPELRPMASDWTTMPLSAQNPLAEAARTGEAVWLGTTSDFLSRYPTFDRAVLRTNVEARAGIPLRAGEDCIGVMGVTLEGPSGFDDEERAFLTAVANLWAQALHRARLAEAEREAIRRALEAETLVTRKKDEFLAMLGHELRNPLSPIVTALQLMRMHGVETREQAVIERQVEHLVRLVDDLLDISRITRGKIELRKTRIELAEVVLRGLETASPLFERRRQRVEVEVAAEGLPVDVDSDRLAQVVSNLLTNASKYSDPGTTVHIFAERVGTLVRLVVRDNGMGIPRELLGAVFDVFFQPPQAPDRAKGGLGLGLAIVYRLVEVHGGRVWAESDGPGMGSAFHVELPLAASAEEYEPARAEGPTALSRVEAPDGKERGRRVLVVDDNEDAALTMADLLRDLGYQVQTAADGVHALGIVKTFRPHVCLLDIGLPAMDGYELARLLQQSNHLPAGARLVAVTGYGQDADKQRTAAAGFDGHLVKPVTFEDLSQVVAS